MSLPESPFLSAEPPQASAETAPASLAWNPDDAGATDCIAEIFAGARKLNQLPGLFDEAAIISSDELLYITLKLMDEPGTRDLPCIPDEQAFWEAIEPPPIFLQRAAE